MINTDDLCYVPPSDGNIPVHQEYTLNYSSDEWHKSLDPMNFSFNNYQTYCKCGRLVATQDGCEECLNKSKEILLIGGAGFIGSVLVGRLLDLGFSVKVADNLYKVGDALLSYVYDSRFSFVKCDITKEVEVEKLFDHQPHAVILLSGIVGLKQCDNSPAMAEAVNVHGWKNVVKYCNVPITSCGTGSVYGRVENGLCDESTTETVPLSVYGKTKLAGEKIVVNAGGVSLRFATCCGVSPNIRLNLMPNQLCFEALTNKVINVFEPHAKRTFIDIRDFADALIFFMEAKNLKYQIYNCGTEKNNLTKLELVTLIQKKTGCIVNTVNTFKDQDARDYFVKYDRLVETGFTLKYSMEQTIDDLLRAIPLLREWSNYN